MPPLVLAWYRIPLWHKSEMYFRGSLLPWAANLWSGQDAWQISLGVIIAPLPLSEFTDLMNHISVRKRSIPLWCIVHIKFWQIWSVKEIISGHRIQLGLTSRILSGAPYINHQWVIRPCWFQLTMQSPIFHTCKLSSMSPTETLKAHCSSKFSTKSQITSNAPPFKHPLRQRKNNTLQNFPSSFYLLVSIFFIESDSNQIKNPFSNETFHTLQC